MTRSKDEPYVAVILAFAVPVLACEKSGQDQQQKADKAQATANQEITNAQIEANDKASNAQANADKKISASTWRRSRPPTPRAGTGPRRASTSSGPI